MCILSQDVVLTLDGHKVIVTDVDGNDDVFYGHLILEDGKVIESVWNLHSFCNDYGIQEYDIDSKSLLDNVV